MGVRSRTSFSILLSLLLNFGIVYILPELTAEKVEDKVLKVGLVAVEKEKVISKKETEALPDKKQSTQTEISEATTQNIIENQEKIKREKMLTLVEMSKSIQAPSFDAISKETESNRKRGDNFQSEIEAFQKEVKFERKDEEGAEKEESIFNDSEVVDDILNDIKEEKLKVDADNNQSTESVKVDKGQVEGLPSGYKLGLENGDIIARWDPSNKEPNYPEKAQLRGLQGTVKVELEINERGDVLSFIIVEGSGVPEINRAIENVGRTWKIYLSKHGLRIKGKVVLEYVFKLKGV